jgi:pimeloyl-ACP methyl ester carboxylesterase
MQPFPGLGRWSHQVRLPSSGVKLHVYDTGEESKSTAVLLHGVGDDADTWRHVLPLINADYRVIAPDLPGFGRSEKVKRSYTIPFFAGSVLELLDYLSVKRAVLVGHSMGAIIAHTIALEHPERVERLVLISGSLVSKVNHLDLGLLLFLTPGLGEWAYNRLRKNPQAAYRTLEPYYNRLQDLPKTDRDFLYQRVNERVWSDAQRQAFLSTIRNLAIQVSSLGKEFAAHLHDWNTPTSVVWGENDHINSVENAHALIKMLPSARLVIVPGAGHNIQQEQAAIAAKTIMNRE